MYKKYNVDELIQNIQTLKEKIIPEEETDLIGLVLEIGFDVRDLKDLTEVCNLRVYDSKKFNEDFEYKNPLEKSQFKKYIKNKIEKLSGILERLEIDDKPGKKNKRIESYKKIIKPEVVNIPARSNKEFGIAFKEIIEHSDVPINMLGRLIGYDNNKIQGYLTSKYKNPSKKFIEEIADFFGINPLYFLEYRNYLGNDYREDKLIALENYKVTKITREMFGIPELSNEEFNISLKKIVRASGITKGKLSKALHISATAFFNYLSGRRIPKTKRIEKISKFFDIDPHYFKEYREDVLFDKKFA